MKRIVVLVVCLAGFVFVGYLFYFPNIVNLSDYRLAIKSLDDISAYYSAVMSLITSFISLVAIILGYLYYENRKSFDENLNERERIRQRISFIIKDLNECDECVLRILNIDLQPQELISTRSRLLRCLESITALIAYNSTVLTLNEEDTRKIIKLNSFIETNNYIMQIKYEDLEISKDILDDIKRDYIEVFYEAKMACLANT